MNTTKLKSTSLPLTLPLPASQPYLLEEPISKAGQYVSEATYWEHYYEESDIHYEWNDGILEEKPVSTLLTYNVHKWLGQLIEFYLITYPIAETIGLETAIRLVLGGKIVIRKPDLAIVLKSNPVPYNFNKNRYYGIPDICIEAVSTTTRQAIERDTIEKLKDYALAKVKEYYIIDAQGRFCYFYFLNEQGEYEEITPDENGVIRSKVLPGFQFRLKDLYERTPFVELVKDEVYKGYLMLFYTQSQERAEQEKHRAEQEKHRAEQEKHRAEQEKHRAEQAEYRVEQERKKLEQANAELARYKALVESMKNGGSIKL